MALSVEQKAQIVKDFQRKEGDTGSSEVQVALLTFRIYNKNGRFIGLAHYQAEIGRLKALRLMDTKQA